VHIRLDSPPQALLLTVEDNGIGFALDSLPERGLGMASMRERVEPLRGSVQIHTAPGRGTRVQVMLPQDDL
jgi:NarL family two-component system sensor histidine kinase LiaS